MEREPWGEEIMDGENGICALGEERARSMSMRRSGGAQWRLWLWQLLNWTCGEVAVDSVAYG